MPTGSRTNARSRPSIREPASRTSDPAASRVLVIPVPFEMTSSYGGNSFRGPDAILEASRQVELFDAQLGLEPYRVAGGIATLKPLDVSDFGGESLSAHLDGLVRKVYDDMVSGKYEWGFGEDLPFMPLVVKYGRFIPFQRLLMTINETHKNGLDVG